MYSEISAILEGFFNPIHELSAIQNVSNTPIELMTYLKLRHDLNPDPNDYKRSARTTIGSTNVILVINSKVDRMIQEYTIFEGVPTAIILFPVYVTEDMDFSSDTSEIILSVVTFLCTIARNYIAKNAVGMISKDTIDGYLLVTLSSPFIIYSHVMYETYKSRISFDDICDHIKEIYGREFGNDDSNSNNILKDGFILLFAENVATYINLVQDVGIYNLLDCGYIVGDDLINIKADEKGLERIHIGNTKKDQSDETDDSGEE